MKLNEIIKDLSGNMNKETIIKFHELKKKASPKRFLGLNNKNETDRELQDLQNTVVELIGIIEKIYEKQN